jgi:hypothetical protein
MKPSEKSRIEFDYEGKHYKLEYTANSLKKLERMGVKFAKLDDAVFTSQEVIFYGAFLANHPNVTKKVTDKIFKALKKSSEDEEPEYDEDGNEIDKLAEALGKMLEEAINELTDRGGNVSWKMT